MSDTTYFIAPSRLEASLFNNAGTIEYQRIKATGLGEDDASIRFVAANQIFDLTYRSVLGFGPRDSASFGPADLVSTTAFAITYSKPRSNAEERETFLRGSLGTNTEFVAAGTWESYRVPPNAPQGFAASQDIRAFVFGSPTLFNELPTTGLISYNYRGLAYAMAPDRYRSFEIRPPQPGEPLTINFQTRQVTGTLYADAAGCSTGLVTCGPLRLTGTLLPDRNRIQGEIFDDERRYLGGFGGATFGPGSREVGFYVILNGPGGRQLIANLVGRSPQ